VDITLSLSSIKVKEEKNLKNILNILENSTKNMTKKTIACFAILLIASMLISIAAVAMPSAAAQGTDEEVHGSAPSQVGYIGPTQVPAGVTANYTISPIAFISVSPNPIGVNQLLLVNVWITFPSGEGKFMNGYTVTITHPDGTTSQVILQSYVADGTSWFNYIPDSTGTYSFQFAFAGEYYPAGYYSNGNYSANFVSGWIYNPSDYVQPATSELINLTVQQAFVSNWDGLIAPLPTTYWSRPIEPNNRNWNLISGNFPNPSSNIGQNQATNSWHNENYGPYIPAVNTPHILWSKVGPIAGVIGGDTGTQANVLGPSSAYPVNTPSVIYGGRCYATVTKSINGGAPQAYAECYDLQTGQIYYDILATSAGGTGVTPTNIAYWSGVDLSVPGAEADAAYGVDLYTISGNFLYRINPSTGGIQSNITIPWGSTNPAGININNFCTYNGYILSFQGVKTINSVYDGVPVTLAYVGYLINWTEQGTASGAAFSSRIVGNISVTLPESYRTLYEPNFGYGYGAYDPVTGISITENRFIYGGFYGSFFEATSFVNASKPIGGSATVLWNITTDPTDSVDAYRPTNAWCENGVYAYEMERGFIQARSEFDGHILWNTTTMTLGANLNNYPWGEFWMYDEAADNGLIYAVGYAGVYALNETTGVIAWQYLDPAVPFETPYTIYQNGTYVNGYSVQDIRIIGGLLYVSNNEHTPTLPPERGWGLICLNDTTGAFQWKVMGTRMAVAAASDGYIVAGSNYDGKLYVLGKGQSATTVSAPQTAITANTPIIISGTVLDQSPQQTGTACVSDASMATWMDYLNMQMPIDGIYHNVTVTGVPVSINAVDPNGNLVNIGTATSDISGTYHFTWTPTTSGTYTISATFAGSNAYGFSSAETAATVVNAPASPTPTTTSTTGYATSADLMTFIIVAIIAIILAIAIATVLILRKH